MITTYTVLNHTGDVQGSGLSLYEAARTVLTHGGGTYKISKSAGLGFFLSDGGGARLPSLYSCHIDPDLAEADIYRQVIKIADWWHNQTVMTDEDFTAMQANNIA